MKKAKVLLENNMIVNIISNKPYEKLAKYTRPEKGENFIQFVPVRSNLDFPRLRYYNVKKSLEKGQKNEEKS